MINNDPKDWSSFVFRFHKSDTIRTLLPLIIIMCLYAAIVAYVQTEYFHITEKKPYNKYYYNA
jgi:putative membrane protein